MYFNKWASVFNRKIFNKKLNLFFCHPAAFCIKFFNLRNSMIFKVLEKKDRAHEQIVFCSNHETGLKAIIAIHSTKLGPALGGCRMYPYETEEQALEDVLRLSEAMSYKAAMADLRLGGGKSVIISDPEKHKTPELLWSFGIHIESFNGRYIVAKDMGITTEDLQYIGDQSSYVVGRPLKRGGVGDPSRSTAQGVYYGIKEAVKRKLKKRFFKRIKNCCSGCGCCGHESCGDVVSGSSGAFYL